MQVTHVQYISAPAPTESDRKRFQIIELEARVENMEEMLKSYDSDAVHFRDLMHSLYTLHTQKKDYHSQLGEYAKALQHAASASAYLSALNHFDEIRKIR